MVSAISNRDGEYAEALRRLRHTQGGAYERLIGQVPGIIYVSELGIEGRCLFVSPQVETLLGWTVQEWLDDSYTFSRSIHPDDRAIEEDADKHVTPEGRHTSEYRLITRTGEVRWFRDDATLVAVDDGVRLWSGVLTDITEQRAAVQRLRRSDERARAIIDTAMDAYLACDDEGRICDWNATSERLFGWTRKEIIGQMLGDTLLPKHVRAPSLADLKAPGSVSGSANGRTTQMSALRRDGEEIPVEVTLWRTWKDDGGQFSAFIRDITVRRALEAQLVRHAYRDAVTGLANRALFQQRLSQHIGVSGRRGFAVLLIGIDDFRSVNDSLGHAAADDLVKGVADRLGASVPFTDTFARVSVDELALLLVDVNDPADARRLGEELADSLRSPTACAGREITVRVSIGIRHCDSDAGIGVEELLSDAGAAMFLASRTGRRVVAFRSSMRAERLRRLQLTEALEHAVARGEMSVHYQPYFSFADGRAVGVEALARWQHPVHGTVSPSEFIAIAESAGQIQALGLFVLETACRDIADLRRQHSSHAALMLSVNVSARQLVDGRFQQGLRAVLAETDLPGQALMLELTETALVEDADGVEERLADIRGAGVQLAVDDFGTRYASLAYLQRFPIDTLKVDRSFVQRVHESSREHRLTGAIITLANTLDLRTIAEGIEEEEHARTLSDLGCDLGQGFLFARPVARAGLLAELASGSRKVQRVMLPAAHPVPGSKVS